MKRLPIWPEGHRFAFTVFDDPDSQPTAVGREIYSFLADLGFRTTRGVWPLESSRIRKHRYDTCGDPEHVRWLLELQNLGFELGYHTATFHTSLREETRLGLERFREFFGHDPATMANHEVNEENIYWGGKRFSSWRRWIYNTATRFRNEDRFHGDEPEHPVFWGDYCREHITYVRNFGYKDIDTLRSCPYMPYYDQQKPYVRFWFASTEGKNCHTFTEALKEANQDLLEERGSLCIMYTHFGSGFFERGKLDSRFQQLMIRLSRKNGWFVPVKTALDLLLYDKGEQGDYNISRKELAEIERRWLLHKLLR